MDENFAQLTESIEYEIARFDTRAAEIARASQSRYRMGMEAGQTMPDFGEYSVPDDAGREQMQAARAEATAAIVGTIDARIASDRRRRTAPASADEVATVTLACSRESIGEDELVALFERYGSNYQLGAAIVERAAKAHVQIPGAESFSVDRQEAVRRASRAMLSRHTQGVINYSPDFIASSIVDGLIHRDLFGRVHSW